MKIFVQLLLGMNFLHRNIIDHRDVKPLNILLFNKGENAKLGDFGLARQIETENESLTLNIGTPYYWAPEVSEKNPWPFKSDIYSLGLTLHFMLRKKLPSLTKNVRTGYFKIDSVYSKDIYELLCKLLKEAPEDRCHLSDLFSS